MSSLRFPTIETKKSLMEDEDYNFINKDKKKKTSTGNPLELVDELKRKIEQQKKQIDNRNMTIQGLQRNFQSLSVIVKNEKAQSAALRAELQNLKMNSDTGDKRAAQYHEKYLILEKEVRNLREELKVLRRTHSECGQYVTLTEEYKRKIMQLQDINQRLHGKIMQGDVDRKGLEQELAKFRGVEKEKRELNQRIVDLEEELKKISDTNNGLNYRQVSSEQALGRAKNEISSRDKKIEQLRMRITSYEKQNQRLENDCEYLKKEITKLTGQLNQAEQLMQNKQMFSKLKQDEEEKAKETYRNLLCEFNELKEEMNKVQEESKEKTGMIDYAHRQIQQLRIQKEQLQDEFNFKESNYQKQVDKLTKSIKELHQQLDLSTGQSSTLRKKLEEEQLRSQDYNQKVSGLYENIGEMNRKMQEHQQKYGQYLKLIAKNQPDVVVTNAREMSKMENSSASTVLKLQGDISKLQQQISELESNEKCQRSSTDNMRKYIKSLEEEVSTKSEELLEKNRLLRKFQSEEEELNRMINNERNVSERIKRQSEAQIMERMRELQHEKMRSKKQIEDEKRRLEDHLYQQRLKNEDILQKQREKAERYSKLLEEYKGEEEKLKEMMNKEQQQLSRLAQEKEQQIKRMIRQKEDDLEKEKRNNKMLWSDNKKLKDLQAKLKEESRQMLEDKEASKREEIDRLKRELERKYKDDVSSMKSQQSNSSELKKILIERNKQFKQLTENHNKLKGQSEFYRNRNKELEALMQRLQRQHKERLVDLERENKSNKQVVQVLDKKLKDAENNLAQSQKKQKRQLKYLYDEIEDMKKAAKSQKVEEKLALVNKSMNDLDSSLKTLMNTMSCNYCVEVVKDCVRLECGHIYCRKCKGGYEPNCGECKKKGTPSKDKMIDDTVSKAQYMNILINTIKDDLSKIGK